MRRVCPSATLTRIQQSATASVLRPGAAARRDVRLGRLEEAVSSTRAVMSARPHFVPATAFPWTGWPLLCVACFLRGQEPFLKCLRISEKASPLAFIHSLCLACGWLPGPLGRVGSARPPGVHGYAGRPGGLWHSGAGSHRREWPVCLVAQEFLREDATLQPRPGRRGGVHQASSGKEGIPGIGTHVSRNPVASGELLMTSLARASHAQGAAERPARLPRPGPPAPCTPCPGTLNEIGALRA